MSATTPEPRTVLPDARRRVLVVSDYAWPTGGIEQFVRELLQRSSVVFDVRLLTWKSETHLLPVGFKNLVEVEFGDVRDAWDAMDWAETVIVITSFNVRLLARLVCDHPCDARDTVCVVQTSGHSDPASAATSVQENWLASLIAQSRVTVAASADVRQALMALGCGSGVVVIENAARLRSTARLRHDGARSRVGFIGRPHPQKGWPLFIRLADELSRRGLTFIANTVSVPPAYHPPGVVVSYQLDDTRLIEFFAACDVLLAPYIRADGLSLAVLEALNCGVPVIGFDTPGLADILHRHRQTVLPATYEALKGAVLAWADDRSPVTAPKPGTVVNWDEQIGRYLQLVSPDA